MARTDIGIIGPHWPDMQFSGARKCFIKGSKLGHGVETPPGFSIACCFVYRDKAITSAELLTAAGYGRHLSRAVVEKSRPTS